MSESLLRPNQINDLASERNRIVEALKDRPEQIQDVSSAKKQVNNINNMLASQAPKELKGQEKDAAVKQANELKEKFLVGMPSQEEMRKCPPGAIGKHMDWEKKNKPTIEKWKSLTLQINAGTDNQEIANIERFRPKKSSLNMDNRIVEGKDYFMPKEPGVATVLSTSDLELIKQRAPAEISSKLCLMDAEGRAIVKHEYITNYKVQDNKNSNHKKR